MVRWKTSSDGFFAGRTWTAKATTIDTLSSHDVEKVVDLEAQTSPTEKSVLPDCMGQTTSARASTKLPLHTIFSLRGIWTLIRPSYDFSHNLMDSTAILFFWHYAAPFLTFLYDIGFFLFDDDFKLTPDMVPTPLSRWQTLAGLLAAIVMVYRVISRVFPLRGGSKSIWEARKYGRRWLWDDSVIHASMADVFQDATREVLWLAARTHELAFSVVVTSLGWNIIWRMWNGDIKDHSRCYIWDDAVGAWVVGYLVLVALVNYVRSFIAFLRERCYFEGKPTLSVVQKVLDRLSAEEKLDADVDEVMQEIVDERIKKRGYACSSHGREMMMTENEAKYGRLKTIGCEQPASSHADCEGIRKSEN